MTDAGTAEIPYTVRRSSRARRVRVNVHAHAGVEVVLPARAPDRAAASAVSELRPWIERRLAETREVLARLAERAGTLPYLDTTLQLVAEPGRTRVHRRGERLLVPGGDARPAIERFYRRAARAEVTPRLDRASARAGLRYSGLDIRGQRTRWASCSASGRMSFNWRLLLAPGAGARIRRLARGLPSAGARPLASLLGAARAPLAGLPRGSGLAGPQRRNAGAVGAQPRCSTGT